jgi:MinD superfamily P-loop ATPase
VRIGIASGKGGTGKTTVATNLARIAGETVCYVDCDVEEPNGHIFLSPEIKAVIPATTLVPKVNVQLCDHCGDCAEVCRYNAVAVLPTNVLIFDDLCHFCGGCAIACPLHAISEEKREIGVIEKGKSGKVDFVSGRLRVGEAITPPLIKAVKQEIPNDDLIIIDASPGTACPVITAIQDVDFALLVTEPTPFGLHDLALAVQMVRYVGIAFGVVINRFGIGTDATEDFCRKEGITVFARIPDSRSIAEAYSRGELIVDALPEFRKVFVELLEKITNEARSSKV